MASLIGDTVTAEVLIGGDPFFQGPTDAIVDNNVEFGLFNGFFSVSIDVNDSGADYLNILSGTVALDETYRLTGLDWVNVVGQIVGATIDNFFGLSTSPVVSVTGPHSVDLTLLANTRVRQGAFVNVSFQTIHGAPVPEPAALVLLGLGMAGIGFGRRKQVSTHTTPLLR